MANYAVQPPIYTCNGHKLAIIPYNAIQTCAFIDDNV